MRRAKHIPIRGVFFVVRFFSLQREKFTSPDTRAAGVASSLALVTVRLVFPAFLEATTPSTLNTLKIKRWER